MIHGSVANLKDRMSPAVMEVVPNDSMKCGLQPRMTLILAKLKVITQVEAADTGIYVTNIIFFYYFITLSISLSLGVLFVLAENNLDPQLCVLMTKRPFWRPVFQIWQWHLTLAFQN